LLDAGFGIPVVLTQPDRPRGRGQQLAPSPVKRLALERGLAVAQPASLKDEAARAPLLAVPIDVLAVAAYGLILPPAILAWPRHGCLNVHASLLPRWRGAAPIQRALLAGDAQTGVTIMQMDAGLDTGPMLISESTPILADDSAATLTGRLASIGARLIVEALRRGAAGQLTALPQPAEGASYAHKLDKREAWLDFALDAELLARRVRAFDPFPVACARRGETTLRFWRARPLPGSAGASPGTVLAASADGLHIACGDGTLAVTELQRPGSRRMNAAEFLAGMPIGVGEVLAGAPAEAAAAP
jgi:methionyl-tRNA formyltransferase